MEDFGAEPVPVSEGKSWFSIGIIWWGVALSLPTFFLAGMVAGPRTLGSSVAIYVFASLVLGALSILTGVLGAKTRLSAGLTARFTFGSLGANVLQILLFFGCWGWFGVQLGFMVSGFGDGGLMLVLGPGLPAWLWMALGGALITLTAMVGYKAIEKLSVFASPLIVLILVTAMFRQFSGERTFAEAAMATGPNPMAFGDAISLLIGSFIIGATVAPDVTRYAKSRGHAAWGMFFGMAVGFAVVLSLAGIMVKGAAGEFDFSKIILQAGGTLWAIAAAVTIVLAAWTTNDINLYSGALSLTALFPKWNKGVITAVSGAVGTALALAGISTVGGFQSFLGMVAVMIPPAVSVMIVDYFLFRGEHNQDFNSERVDETPRLRPISVASWMVGAGFGFLVQFTAIKVTRVTAIDAILAAALAHLVLMLATRHRVAVKA
jgi:cytosine permease